MGGASVQSLPAAASQDRTLVAFADGEIDRAGGAQHEADDGGFLALADDPQGAMPALEREVFDVGGARF